MRIRDLEEGSDAEEPVLRSVDDCSIRAFSPKMTIIGVGARFLFYPTLLYNVLRNKIQVEFRWWDEVDQFLLLGAVPFPGDVPHLKQLGVGGVVTLNEPYETLVPTSLFHAYEIEHLVLPTRDYLFAPTFADICRAVEFIHKNVSCGKTTYVHCKAGRGRSTTIVLCYLVKYRHMTPRSAYEYVRVIRPRVLLASSQWQAVQKYYHLAVENDINPYSLVDKRFPTSLTLMATSPQLSALEEASYVMISKSDLDGYDESGGGSSSSRLWAELSFVRLSCLWLRCHGDKKRGVESCSLEATDQMGAIPRLVSGVVVKL